MKTWEKVFMHTSMGIICFLTAFSVGFYVTHPVEAFVLKNYGLNSFAHYMYSYMYVAPLIVLWAYLGAKFGEKWVTFWQQRHSISIMKFYIPENPKAPIAEMRW